jgi:hypothetical protein
VQFPSTAPVECRRDSMVKSRKREKDSKPSTSSGTYGLFKSRRPLTIEFQWRMPRGLHPLRDGAAFGHPSSSQSSSPRFSRHARVFFSGRGSAGRALVSGARDRRFESCRPDPSRRSLVNAAMTPEETMKTKTRRR